MPKQPFAFAGDTTLTAVESSDGQWFVQVDRLTGDEYNEFTMINVKKDFPASPPATTVAIGGSLDLGTPDKIRIPYAFTDVPGTRCV